MLTFIYYLFTKLFKIWNISAMPIRRHDARSEQRHIAYVIGLTVVCCLICDVRVCDTLITPGVNKFVSAKDINTQAIVCGITDSSIIPFAARSRLDCAQQCRRAVTRNETTCIGFNFMTGTNTCELFTMLPNFKLQTGCTFYGPDICYTTTPDVNQRIAAEDCWFPYTYKGKLYYECVPIITLDITKSTVCDVYGCRMKHFQKAVCYTTDYTATNITTDIAIPTQSGTIPALIVNNWIMIQQNVRAGLSFNVNWTTYKAGFGTLTQNYWMGNDNIHLLTSSDNYMLRIEVMSAASGWTSAEYDMFYIGPESISYQIYLGLFPPPGPPGVCSQDGGDSMQYIGLGVPIFSPPGAAYHGFMPFSTYDWGGQMLCAQTYLGGWWYNNCYDALLNTDSNNDFVWGAGYKLKVSRMMIKLV